MENLIIGLQQFADPIVLAALIFGTFLGLTVGALPGLNDSITIAVLIPITFGMNPHVALALLVGIYCASSCGGSIPAVLLDIPGTASSMITALDGHPMSLMGKSKQALSLCMTSSVFGGISSSLVLLFFAPILASYALKFGPPEYFMLAILGLSTVIGMAGKNAAKNFLAMSIGLWLSCIGMSPTTGIARFTFGNSNLFDGIPLIPRMIGLFGVLSILKMYDAHKKKSHMSQSEITETAANEPELTEINSEAEGTSAFTDEEDKIALPNLKMTKRLLPTWLRSSFIGNILGVIPGAGMTMAIFVAYDQAQKSKPDLEFGTGVPEGIAAPESANNAVVASSMVPLLSLGIPGNSTSALFLGALTIQGLRTGPTLFKDSPDIAYLVIVGFLLANIVMLPMSLAYCKYFASKVLKLNPHILGAAVLVLCVTGTFAYANNVFHIYAMTFFGLLGYVIWKFDIPQAPLILTSILGSMMESNWISTQAYGGAIAFIERPVSRILVILALIFVFSPVIKSIKSRFKAKAA
ncbi:tripartite tricarboxylate transporter permease [Fusibacter ferrireducens]|uniref:Tripartite tricarboxylate transporter permease n=1 Tax=Fusibacter ferrireducens TaxID=2785058 RepID=A0ABR9ZNU0_9FIRM|nr:tripartite tricarboxylate transporter permease [Fusibacter ferrireducens]MBF4692111.1 tripartite tricarboxylate transporter permease [Fusibacter ferrireducens]